MRKGFIALLLSLPLTLAASAQITPTHTVCTRFIGPSGQPLCYTTGNLAGTELTGGGR